VKKKKKNPRARKKGVVLGAFYLLKI